MTSASPAAAADDVPASAEQATQEQTTHWYGWQTLIVDASAAGAFTLSAIADGDSVRKATLASGLVIYLAAPVVHLFHGRGGAAGADLAVRVLSPVIAGGIGMIIGALIPPRNECATSPTDSAADKVAASVCAPVGAVAFGKNLEAGLNWGMAAGAVGASMIDSLLLGREKVTVNRPTPPSTAWTPTLRHVDGGATIGVGGQF